MSSYSRQALEAWLKTIKIGSVSVLDCGGSQNSVRGRVGSWEAKEYKVLDLNVPHETKIKPDISFDLNKHFAVNGKYLHCFDVAFALEISEYLWHPVRAFENIGMLLKPNGILYLSTHFIYKIHPPCGLDYLRYTPDGIEKILKETGFEIIEHKHRMSGSGLLPGLYRAEKMRGHCDINENIIGSLIKCKKI